MIQILEPAGSFGSDFGKALGGGFGKGFSEEYSEGQKLKKKYAELAQENKAIKETYGIDLSPFVTPETRQAAFADKLKGRTKDEDLKKEYEYKTQLEKDKQKFKGDERLNIAKRLGLGIDENQETQEQEISPHMKYPGIGIEKEKNKPKSNERKSELKNKDKPPHTQKEIDAAGMVDPTVANNWQRQNEEWNRQKEHKEKTEIEKQKQIQHEKEFFHTETKDYDKTLSEQANAAEKKNRALDRQIPNIDKLGWSERAVSALFGGTVWGDLLKSKTSQEFDANTLPQLEGQRQILGGILSDADIRLLMQKIVTSTKNPEANKIIAKNMKFENDLTIAKDRIGKEIKNKNNGYRPSNYLDEIDRIYNERYGKDIQDMFQEIMSLPDDNKKLNSIGRRKVPPGTQLDQRAIDMYWELSGKDELKATQMAEEDNYDVPK